MSMSQVKILSMCPDTLVLNCYPGVPEVRGEDEGYYKIERRALPAALCEELKQLKEEAQAREEPVPTRFVFVEASLKMQARGGDGFGWILKNALITVAVNRSSKMQLWAQVRVSSLCLQTWRDLGKVIHDVHTFLRTIFGEYITLQPSSLDLAVDLLFFDLGTHQNIKEHFITRAQTDDERPQVEDDQLADGPDSIKRRWRRVTGLSFGTRKAKVSAIIYDKTHEIKYQSPDKEYMRDIWQVLAEKQGFCLLPTARVMRLEIRLRRPALGEMKQEGVFHGIDDAYELEGYLSGLWSYAVGHLVTPDGLPDGWLRYIIPTTDKNRSRWPVHPDWKVIQSAFQLPPALEECPLPDDNTPPPTPDFVAYARERKREVNLDKLVAQIAGCVVTAEAWRRSATSDADPNLSDTFYYLREAVTEYLDRKRKDFVEAVQKKADLYDLAGQLAKLDTLASN